MAAQADIEAMDWGPGTIAVGTREAEEAQAALVSAAVVLCDGAPSGPLTETETQRMWRCGKLRSSSPSAVPLLCLAVQNTDHR